MARDLTIEIWTPGVHNLNNAEKIPNGAASDALNWISLEDRIELIRGKLLLGAKETGNGASRGHHFGNKNDGSTVQFRKMSTKIQYYNTTTELWVDIITGLTDGAEYSFTNYTSLAGNFVYMGGVDGLYKICTASPGDYTDCYSSSKNFKGKILISDARMFMWDLVNDKTGVYGSWIDVANYTTVSAEATTPGSGTLAFKAGGSTRTCFGVVITLTGSGEKYTDDYNGILTGDAGGTGTINYMTGAYTISAAGVGTVDYQWEDSNNNGVTDFTKSSPRQAGEGFIFRQDAGGDAIKTIKIFNGIYYSLKENSAYELDLKTDDTTATNLPFRRDIGVPFFRAATATGIGIVFLDTANPDKPKLSQLQKNVTGDNLIPVDLASHFDFSKYDWDECAMETWGEYIVFSGKTKGADNNDRLFLYNLRLQSMNICNYNANTIVKDAGLLYVGDSLTDNTFQVFSGFDDDTFEIENYWIGGNDRMGTEELKKVRRMVLRGQISIGQTIDVYVGLDDDDFQLIGTVDGNGTYVDKANAHTIGSNMFGVAEIGGGGPEEDIYDYFIELRPKAGKFHKRKLKFVANGLGYASVLFEMDKDIQLSGQGYRIPIKYRT